MRMRPSGSLIAACALVALGCSDDTASSPASQVPTTIELSTTSTRLTHLGETAAVEATVLDQDGDPMDAVVAWSVGDAAVATVSAGGVVTAMGNGTTTVRARAGEAVASAQLTVDQEPASLTVSAAAVSLSGIGATFPVAAAALDAGGHPVADAAITWRSSDEGVATVSSAGLITSRGIGGADVTAESGTITARIVVTVVTATVRINTPPGMDARIRGVGVRFPLTAQATGVLWSSSDSAVARIDGVTGLVQTLAEGTVTFTATIPGGSGSWTSEVVRIRRMPVDTYLATPIAGALWEVPVILVEYHPTADGTNLDVLRAPNYWQLEPMTLDSLERLTMRFARRRKMMVEQGSRFRGYRDASALPSLGYRVVAHMIVYDQVPPHPTKRQQSIPGAPRFEGWHAAFAELGLVPMLRAHKAREVWVTWSSFDGNYPSYDASTHRVDDMRAGWESNMVSQTGDVSNSDRDPTDAPLVEHTYIIYGINFRRSQAEAVHNVGHQLEAMLSHVAGRQDGNDFLFWRNFVGFTGQAHPLTPGTGRAGWTHMPPNTTSGYDYLNTALVASDIEDWRPDNSGSRKTVNVATWGSLTYPWPGEAEFPQRVESQWYTYWFQSFPGRGNRIPHGTRWMTNWWAFVADWDAALASGLGLHGPSQAAVRGAGSPYAFPPSAVVPAPTRHPPRR